MEHIFISVTYLDYSSHEYDDDSNSLEYDHLSFFTHKYNHPVSPLPFRTHVRKENISTESRLRSSLILPQDSFHANSNNGYSWVREPSRGFTFKKLSLRSGGQSKIIKKSKIFQILPALTLRKRLAFLISDFRAQESKLNAQKLKIDAQNAKLSVQESKLNAQELKIGAQESRLNALETSAQLQGPPGVQGIPGQQGSVGAPGQAFQLPNCPSQYTLIDQEQCYLVSDNTMTWDEASAFCISNGGRLWDNLDNYERLFAFTVKYEFLWLGIVKTQTGPNMPYFTENGVAVPTTWAGWAEGQPSVANARILCTRKDTFGVKDKICTRTHQALCVAN